MKRISVVGCPGSGKSTFGLALSQRLSCSCVSLDELSWLPGWTMRETEDFRDRVTSFVEANDRWVIDGNYLQLTKDLVWANADTVIWLDLPRWLVMWRVFSRTVGDIVRGRTRCNGNTSTWARLFSLDQEDNIVVWAWNYFSIYRQCYTTAVAEPQWAHLTFIRLKTPSQVRQFLGEHKT